MANPVATDVGHVESEVKSFVDYAKHYDINYSDFVSTLYKLPIPKGQWVLGVRLHVLTAFAGGSPTAKVGDATSDLGFILTTDIDTTVLDAVVDSRMLGHDITGTHTLNTYAKGGKFYPAAAYVLLTIAASATAGKLGVDVFFAGQDADAPKDMIRNY